MGFIAFLFPKRRGRGFDVLPGFTPSAVTPCGGSRRGTSLPDTGALMAVGSIIFSSVSVKAVSIGGRWVPKVKHTARTASGTLS